MSSSLSTTLILILADSLTAVVPLNHVTSGLGLALHLHFMVMSVPLSFGIILGFSMKDGANPAASPPENVRHKHKDKYVSGGLGKAMHLQIDQDVRTLEVQRNVRVAFTVYIERVATVVAAVFARWIRNFKGK